MHIDGLDFLAPSSRDEPWNEAQAFGSAVWLWMHSMAHRDAQLHTLNVLLLPAIKNGQFVLVSEMGRPVAYFAWANFSEEAERRYLASPAVCMHTDDWASGERTWVLDWIAPFGHTAAVVRVVTRRLMANRIARALYHRSERGIRVRNFKGIGMRAKEAHAWFAAHPPAIPSSSTPYLDCSPALEQQGKRQQP